MLEISEGRRYSEEMQPYLFHYNYLLHVFPADYFNWLAGGNCIDVLQHTTRRFIFLNK